MAKQATADYNFKKSYPKLAREWNDRNAKGPESFTPRSGQKVWWRCKNGHEWDAVIASRASGVGCPFCSGQRLTAEKSLEALFPAIAVEWDLAKNRPITPSNVFPNSSKKYWWVCSEGHSYDAKPNNRIGGGKGCRYCANQEVLAENSIAKLHPEIAEQLSEKNLPLTAEMLSPGSNRKVWWRCKCGHEWKATSNTRIGAGSGCPSCSNRVLTAVNSLQAKNPEIASEWDYEKNIGLTPNKITAASTTQVWWKCPLGHSYSATVRKRTCPERTGCPRCSNQTSRNELRIFAELKVVYPEANNRVKVAGTELDIYLKSLKVGIEYDGSYFHKHQSLKDRKKSKHLEKAGVTLIRVRERPLKAIGRFDYILKGKRPCKADINAIIDSVQLVSGRRNKRVAAYKGEPEFLNNALWQELISAMPLPPDGKSLAQNKKLAAEWNYERNKPLTPEHVFVRTGVSYWWICQLKHEWEASVDYRAKGRGCPYCSNRKVGYGNSLAEKATLIATEWYYEGNGDYTPHDLTSSSGKSFWWKCSNNHIFRARIVDRVNRKSQCLYCPGPGRGRAYNAPDKKLFFKRSKTKCTARQSK